jgi:hypothetical protein
MESVSTPTADIRREGETRVALVACSGVLGGVIRESLSAVPGVVVVLDVPDDTDRDGLAGRLGRLAPDVVVWRMNDDFMLLDHPEFFGARHAHSVLAVLGDGASGSLWRLRPHRAVLGALSPGTLAEAVRSAAAGS